MHFDSPYNAIAVLMVFHFLGDFIFQTNRMALNKSTDNTVLTEHVFWYSILFAFVDFRFAIVNAVLHLGIDYYSSRIGKKYWENENRRMFFITVGADQLLHMLCLIYTYALLVEGVK